MKFVVAVLLVASLAVLCQGEHMSKEERKKKIDQVVKKCQETEKATDQDVQEFRNYDVPSTDTGKCLRACTMETFGMLKGSKLDLEAMAAMTAHHTTDVTAQNVLKEVAQECEALSADPNRCVLVGNFIQCSRDKLVARGVDPKKMHSE